jgi:hypothetical protein
MTKRRILMLLGLLALGILIVVVYPLLTGVPPYGRAGFGMATVADGPAWARRLGAGWWLDWSVHSQPVDRNRPFWQMIRLGGGKPNPDEATIAKIARQYPGYVWVIGNEPDNIYQDKVLPEDYARLYHDLYMLIKQADPTAQVAIGAVSVPTHLRLEYLDRVLKAYQQAYNQPLPTDWWTVHNYVLREERQSWGAEIPPGLSQNSGLLIEPDQHGSLPIFKEQIILFRAWMANNGYRNSPLALTEFGILFPVEFGFTPAVVRQYLLDSFAWLDSASDPAIGYPEDDNRLVQRWAWFSLSDPNYPVADLADLKNDRLTEIGQAFLEYVTKK